MIHGSTRFFTRLKRAQPDHKRELIYPVFYVFLITLNCFLYIPAFKIMLKFSLSCSAADDGLAVVLWFLVAVDLVVGRQFGGRDLLMR
jgi:hypothetical protein